MRRLTPWVLLTLLALLLTTAFGARNSASAESPPSEPGLRLLATAHDHLLLEWVTGDVQVDPVTVDGRAFHRVHVDGLRSTTDPGQPQLPTFGALLGVPTDTGVTVTLLSAESRSLGGANVLPAPAYAPANPDAPTLTDRGPLRPEFAYDQQRYATNAYTPARIAAIGDTGYLRDQAFAQLQINPVRYNPVTGDLRAHTRLVLRVSWDDAQTPDRVPGVTQPAFEALLAETLFNYSDLDRPPVAAVGEPAPVVQASGLPSALNVRVRDAGMYQITHADLVSAGIDPGGIDPDRLKLRVRGAEVAIRVTGAADGRFDAGDAVIFYGQPYEDTYTDRNNYVLSWGGAPGLRMIVRSVAPGGATLATRFPHTLHAEEDTHYWWEMPNGAEQDHWYWQDRIAHGVGSLPTSRDYTIELPSLATGGANATLSVALRAATFGDHGTRIKVNGTQVDSQTWSDIGTYVHTVSVAPSLFNSGSNTITVEAFDPGSGAHQVYVNWIEVTIDATYSADNDRLTFKAPSGSNGTRRFELDGFSSNSVALYDVTLGKLPELLTNASVSGSSGNYTLAFQDSVTGSSVYEAFTAADINTPVEIVADRPSSWRTPLNGADYIIIAPDELMDEVQPLAAQRSADGLRVAVVDIQDIYDEFNHGIETPLAVRNFLEYAYLYWTEPAPLYALLASDATFDYKNNLNSPFYRKGVPTQLVEADDIPGYEGQAASDNWLAAFAGNDVLPDMFIGRIPLGTSAAFTAHVDKILDYEQSPPAAAWNTKTVFVADDDPHDAFEANSDRIIDHLPAGFSVQRIFADDYTAGVDDYSDIRNDIMDAIDDGVIMAHYTGHGNTNRWGSWGGGSFFSGTDVPNLNNTDRYPLITIGDCLSGYFIGSSRSMAEALVYEPDIGAVAVWAPSWLGYSSGHTYMTEELYDTLFQDGITFLGDATTAAKLRLFAGSASWAELVETYMLFGDPFTQLGVPQSAPIIADTTPSDGASNVPIDTPIEVTFNRAMNQATVSFSSTPSVTFTPVWSGDGRHVTLNHADLPHGTTLTITPSGQDLGGVALDSAANRWSFTVTTDNIAPDVNLSVNNGTLTNVPLFAPVSAGFTEEMRTSSITWSLSPSHAGEFEWLDGGFNAQFSPGTVRYQAGTTYTFRINGGVDEAGNDLATSRSVTFTTIPTAGDVTCDNQLTVVDALFALQYDVSLRGADLTCPLSADTLFLPACDTNGDQVCNVIDALFLLQCDVGISNMFCP